jgi:predicted helicase
VCPVTETFAIEICLPLRASLAILRPTHSMATLTLKPTHKPVTAYYESLAKFAKLGIKYERAVCTAFHELLEHCARQFDWKLVPEYRIKRKGQADASADGALLDNYGLNHGLWEAKDSAADLDKEIKHKFSIGYPKQNILFWQPDRAVLYQNGERFWEADLTRPDELVKVLTLFLEFAPPAIAEWEKAVEEFKDRIPQIGASLKKLIETERQTNKKFITAFEDFCSLCRGSLNPNISIEAVEEMIIQHILTERIFRKIFDVADFISRNVIAQEIEKVITALNSRSFSRDDFSKSLEHFYGAIENAAATITDFHEKQTFLNTVYERFFQGFCVKVADTHGIVYTPQPLVNFMVASVEHVLKEEFGKTLADRDVHILDPFTGTGNFIVNIMRHIPKSALPHKFAQELHCNEIMLLPYYVASMNIEHAYYEATGKYEPFEGICLVDTFRTLEPPQSEFDFISEKNSERINRQRKAPIRVIIANPPYNAWQTDENENNRNVTYGQIEKLVRETYGKDSKAQNKNSLSDPYVKAFRYASELIKDNGVIAYVSNGAFVDSLSCDGMRKNLGQEFDLIYVLDLGGNVRKNPKLSGTTHNVFGIQVGVCITLLIKLPGKSKDAKRSAKISYHTVPVSWRKEEKYAFLEKTDSVAGVKWKNLKPDKKQNWLDLGYRPEFDDFLPIGDRDLPAGSPTPPIFSHYSRGVSTSRDAAAVNFNRERVAKNMEAMIDAYNAQVDGYHRLKKKPAKVEDFIDFESGKIAWSELLRKSVARGAKTEFVDENVRPSLYRPFTSPWLYFDALMNERRYGFPDIFPKPNTKNLSLCVTDAGSEKPFMLLASNRITDLHLVGGGASTQCFPLFTYSEDGKERRDNITPKALTLFQIFYDDDGITRADIFHYVYALLHHPAYRTRYAENLKRELPRIPFVGCSGGLRPPNSPAKKDGGHRPPLQAHFFPLSAVEKMQGDAKPDHNPKASAKLFHAFAAAGKKLADLHVNYESAKEFPLQRQENKTVKLDWRVEAMKLSKDKASLFYNDFLMLSGIPAEVYNYRLGNRSALEWVIDQYRVTRDEQGNIASDPNRLDGEQYIVRLIAQVITVSLETQKVVKGLPELSFGKDGD